LQLSDTFPLMEWAGNVLTLFLIQSTLDNSVGVSLRPPQTIIEVNSIIESTLNNSVWVNFQPL
jgi:hypothetical protein